MPQEPDYKAAYEILDEALREADRILRQARLRVALRMEQADDGWTPEDEGAAPPDTLWRRGPLPQGEVPLFCRGRPPEDTWDPRFFHILPPFPPPQRAALEGVVPMRHCRVPLAAQIFLALGLGILAGLCLTGAPELAAGWVAPFGTIFLNLLQD